VAFLLPLIDRLGRPATRLVHTATVLFVAVVALQHTLGFAHGAPAIDISTGGWAPPIGINLRFDLAEGALVSLAALTALASLFFLPPRDETRSLRGHVIQLLLLVGSTGLIMTRDLFNLYVFLEITSIGTYAIVAFGKERSGLEAGFKYMVLGSAASTFILLAVAFLYKATGTLNIDVVIGDLPGVLAAGSGAAAVAMEAAIGLVLVLLLVGLTAELKLFPLNGPAIDLYDGVDPGVMALLVGITVNAMLYAAWKVLPIFPESGVWMNTVATLGMLTFILANLIAGRQKRVRRMLGYSSSAQIGLLVFLLPFVRSGAVPAMAVGLLLVNHTLAKAGLLWLAGAHGGERLADWRGAFARKPCMRLGLVVLLLAITGMPPFAGFFGKWDALVGLARSGAAAGIGPLLLGSLLEFVYYFRWLRVLGPRAEFEGDPRPYATRELLTAGTAVVASLLLGGFLLVRGLPGLGSGVWVMAAGGLVATALSARLPVKLTAAVALAVFAGGAAMLLMQAPPALDSMSGFFTWLILGGAALTLVANLGLEGPAPLPGLLLMLTASLLQLVGAESLLAFFIGWELMTWLAYLAIGQGRKAGGAAYQYMLFSAAAGFLVLGGLMVAAGAGVETIGGLSGLQGMTAVSAWILLVLGIVVKSAAFGVHIYAPGAYTEAPDGFTPFLSGIVSKMPVFALMLVLGRVLQPQVVGLQISGAHILAWVAALTAFSMTMMALLQEDAKKLLAYSSIAQVGYVVLGLAVLSPLGWYAALFHTVHHMVFKMLLFFAIAGVILRTGTRQMHRMGGLITRMPISFVSVLIGIIAVSGVPPLAGFTGKWLLYHALLDRGWPLLLGFTMFGSLVAFLYLFRLIHSVFLGQLKTRHREIKEAPLALLIPQVVLMGLLMVLAVAPQVVLEPAGQIIEASLGTTLQIVQDGALVTPHGYFHPANMMIFVGVLFAVAVVLLLVMKPRTTKVKQLDIGFAGEVPPPPEELHFAYDFHRPYKRAFAPILGDLPTRVWSQVGEAARALAGAGGRFYTGNAQTYVLYAVIAVVILAAVSAGGVQ
jgi:formate hydrogenlyase subunit 3/multisubunit Na+/H+ antiporter MnhD subunit